MASRRQSSSYTLRTNHDTVPRRVTNVFIHCRVKAIEKETFERCTDLRTVNFANKSRLQTIGKYAFAELRCLRIEGYLPNSIHSLDTSAFYGCNSLLELLFPRNGNLQSIGESAFSWCRTLERVQLPQDLRRIEKWAFSNCPRIQEMELPSSLEYVGEYAFRDCWYLLEVRFYNSPRTSQTLHIATGAFSICYDLKAIHFPQTQNLTLGDMCFDQCSDLVSVELSSNNCRLRLIGSVFKDCRSLSSISFASCHVRQSSDSLFHGCKRLHKVVRKVVLKQIQQLREQQLPVENVPTTVYMQRYVSQRYDTRPIHSRCYHSSQGITENFHTLRHLVEASVSNHSERHHGPDNFRQTPFHVLLSSAHWNYHSFRALDPLYSNKIITQNDVTKTSPIYYMLKSSYLLDGRYQRKEALRCVLTRMFELESTTWIHRPDWKQELHDLVSGILMASTVSVRVEIFRLAQEKFDRYCRCELVCQLVRAVRGRRLLLSGDWPMIPFLVLQHLDFKPPDPTAKRKHP